MSSQPTVATHNPARTRFEIELGNQTALLDYQLKGESVAFTHTKVPPAFEGKGIGSLLVKTALEWAKEQNLAVLPYCTFVLAYVRRHPEWIPALEQNWQERAGRTRKLPHSP